MKIGELFIALGFKVDATPLDETERRMEGAAVKAGKLALVVNAVNAAMLAMVDSAMKAAVSIRLWEQTTGGSADELQRWGQAARIAGISADDLKGAVVALQDARNAFALGEPQNVGAWSILGVNPAQDPFAVLTQLRARLAGMKDPNLMRGLLGKVGMAGVMPLLQAPAAEFDRLRTTILSRPQLDRLVELNKEWQRLLVSLGAVKNQLSAALAPALRIVGEVLSSVAARLASVTNWLNSGTTSANVARFAVGLLAVAMLALGGAVALVAGFLFVFSPKMLAAAASMLPMIGNLSIVAALLAAIYLVWDDVATALSGGDSVSGAFADWVLGFDSIRKVIEAIWTIWDKVVQSIKAVRNLGEDFFVRHMSAFVQNDDSRFEMSKVNNRGSAWAVPRTPGGAGGSWTQENNVEINIDGSGDPEAAGRAAGRSVRDEINSAAAALPVPNR